MKWVYNMSITKDMKRGFPIKGFIISILVLGVVSLVGYNMHDRIMGSPLIVNTVANGSNIDSQFLSISGRAPHARELLINGRPVGIDRSGSFNDGVLLSPGYNIVEIALRDQFGNEKIRTYQYVVSSTTAVAVVKKVDHTKEKEELISIEDLKNKEIIQLTAEENE